MSGQRPNIQRELAFPPEDPGEAPRTDGEGTEPSTTERTSQNPVLQDEDVSRRTAVYGPVRTVVWEGRSRKAPPYPDRLRASPQGQCDVGYTLRGHE
jgi:hypothetical protein